VVQQLSRVEVGGAPLLQFAKAIFFRWYVLANFALVAAGLVEQRHVAGLLWQTGMLGRFDAFVPVALLVTSAVAFAFAAYGSWRQEYARASHHLEYSSTLAEELTHQGQVLDFALAKVKKMQDAPRSLGMARDMSNRASFEIHSAKKRLDAITSEITHMKDKLDFLNDDLKKPNTSLASAISVLNQTLLEMKLDADLDDLPAKPAMKR
jgi:hypothetical protein